MVGNVEGGVLTGSIVVFFCHGRWARPLMGPLMGPPGPAGRPPPTRRGGRGGRSADKWARRDREGVAREVVGEVRGAAERAVRGGVGRRGIQAWWEKWGEQTDATGPGAGSIKWTDKWAENGAGTRWGTSGRSASPSGATTCKRWARPGVWARAASDGAAPGARRWTRTAAWASAGRALGERWDTVEAPPRFYSGGGDRNASDGERAGRPGNSGDGFGGAYGWDDALADSARLLAIDIGDERAI